MNTAKAMLLLAALGTALSPNITRGENVVPIKKKQKAGPNVGPNAKKGQPNRKIAQKLEWRRADWTRMMAVSSDPTGRKGSGGFKRPGAMHL